MSGTTVPCCGWRLDQAAIQTPASSAYPASGHSATGVMSLLKKTFNNGRHLHFGTDVAAGVNLRCHQGRRPAEVVLVRRRTSVARSMPQHRREVTTERGQ
jgi:hypothetical protein